jgi:hypothetical protein
VVVDLVRQRLDLLDAEDVVAELGRKSGSRTPCAGLTASRRSATAWSRIRLSVRCTLRVVAGDRRAARLETNSWILGTLSFSTGTWPKAGCRCVRQCWRYPWMVRETAVPVGLAK